MRRGRPGTPLGPVPQVGARAFLGIGRVDLACLAGILTLALVLRIFSPIFPDWLSHPFSGAPVTTWNLGFPYYGAGKTSVTVDGPQSLFPRQGCDSETPGDISVSHQEQLCGFVFDEVYFPIDASYDAQQPAHDYFDPEPPLAKLLMAPAIELIGFQPWSWRIACAIFGSLLCALVYLIAMRLRRDRFFAGAAGVFMCLDGLELVESRTGVIDIIAVFFSAFAVYAFLLHWQARTRRQWTATLYLFAATLGIAFGAKLTALAPLALAAVLIAGRFLEPLALRAIPALRRVAGPGWGEAVMWRDAAGGGRAAGHYMVAASLVVVVFAASYSRYLTIDHNVPNFASCSPNTGLLADANNPATLLRHPSLSQAGRAGAAASLPQRMLWFVGDIYESVYGHNKASLVYHGLECRDHPYGSRWYTWPGLAHPVLFYSESGFGAGETAWISNLGNPALWWMAIPALLFCAWAMAAGPRAWRMAVLALLAVALALLVILFHFGEKPPVTVDSQVYLTPLALGPNYLGAELLMCIAGALVVICAVVGRRFVPAFIVLGFLVTWLMWMPGNQARVLFIYHMLNAVPFLALGLAYALTALRTVRLSTRMSSVTLRSLAWAGVGVVAAAFVFFYPAWVGMPQADADHTMRIWFDSWSNGWS